MLYVALQQYDRAIDEAYGYLRSPGGKRASTYNHLGIVHYFRGELQQSALMFQDALDLAQENAGIRCNLEKVKADLGEVETGVTGTFVEGPGEGKTKGEAVGVDEDSFYWWE